MVILILVVVGVVVVEVGVVIVKNINIDILFIYKEYICKIFFGNLKVIIIV